MSWILIGLCFLALISHLVSLWQLLAALSFPLHRRAPDTTFAPGLSLLKPLKGTDGNTRECLRSWFTAGYTGPVQLLLGVRDPEDPVCDVVRSLLAEFPEREAQLVICPDQPGANAKVCTLVQLQPLARHEVLVVSDADVRVPADFLSQVVQPLRDPGNSMVNCFYALANPSTWAQHWEAVATNADFWSQVLQSRTLAAQDFALGAVMAVRRSALERIGGFRVLVDHLADDFQLGQRVFQAGGTLALSPITVECWDAPAGWRTVWAHQLRWARTVRVCRPGPYALSIVSNVTVWTGLAMLAGFRYPPILMAGSIILGLRIAFAVGLAGHLVGRRPGWLTSLVLVPAKDLLGVIVWALAFVGQTVVWRGIRYRVERDGRLHSMPGH